MLLRLLRFLRLGACRLAVTLPCPSAINPFLAGGASESVSGTCPGTQLTTTVGV